MAGATAATAAGVTASQASTITINLVNNYISAAGGNHLNADLTGDGHPDLTLANAFHSLYLRTFGSGFTISDAGVTLNGVRAGAHRSNNKVPDFGTEVLGSRTAHFSRIPLTNITTIGTYSLTGSIPLFFKDLHVNGGAPTMGSLQVTVSTRGRPAIQLDSFTYNSNTSTAAQASSHTVPDQGSSLALLAMGAGGIVAFRRWRPRKYALKRII
jgi:hypothetical protein